MMLESISKKKIYFYLLIFFFLSTVFNLNINLIFNDLNKIKTIEISGVGEKEETQLREALKVFKNNNIFFLRKDEIIKKLSIISFIDHFSIKKVFPSRLSVFAKKTDFLGVSIIEGQRFYIGENGKLTVEAKVNKEENLPFVFGKFKVKDFIKLQETLIKEKINIKKIKNYYFHQSKRWDLEFYNGIILKLPFKNINSSLKIYNSLIDNNKISANSIVDLRVPNNVILTNEEK